MDCRPVIVGPVQHPSHLFEGLHPLDAFRLVFPRDYEGRLCALSRDCNVFPPPPRLSVPVTPLHTLFLDQLPRWHVHATQVAAGQRFIPLLHHRYPQKKCMYMNCSLIRPALYVTPSMHSASSSPVIMKGASVHCLVIATSFLRHRV